jgi:hypothetical protein
MIRITFPRDVSLVIAWINAACSACWVAVTCAPDYVDASPALFHAFLIVALIGLLSSSAGIVQGIVGFVNYRRYGGAGWLVLSIASGVLYLVLAAVCFLIILGRAVNAVA